jgi:hypothetical protein
MIECSECGSKRVVGFVMTQRVFDFGESCEFRCKEHMKRGKQNEV